MTSVFSHSISGKSVYGAGTDTSVRTYAVLVWIDPSLFGNEVKILICLKTAILWVTWWRLKQFGEIALLERKVWKIIPSCEPVRMETCSNLRL